MTIAEYKIKNLAVIGEILQYARNNSDKYSIVIDTLHNITVSSWDIVILFDFPNIKVNNINNTELDMLKFININCDCVSPTITVELTIDELNLITCYMNDFDTTPFIHTSNKLYRKISELRKILIHEGGTK